MARKEKLTFSVIIGLFGLLLIGTGSWAIYALINQGAGDVLSLIGIENIYIRLSIIIVVVVGGLILTGKGILKALRIIIGR